MNINNYLFSWTGTRESREKGNKGSRMGMIFVLNLLELRHPSRYNLATLKAEQALMVLPPLHFHFSSCSFTL